MADTAICFGDTTPDLIFNGTIVQWYGDPLLTMLLQTGDPFNPGVTTVGVYTYYVTDSTGGCAATISDTVTLTIYALPVAPAVSNDTIICFNTPAPDHFATGVNLRWYDSPALTNQLGSGPIYNSGLFLPGDYTFYVTQTDTNACESLADSIKLSIVTDAPLPIANDTTACFGDTIPDLSANGVEVQWYSDKWLNTLVWTGSPFPTGQTQVGIYTYYVTQTIGCESLPDTVTLTINPNPLVTLNTYTTYMNSGDTVTLMAYNAATYLWSPPTGLNTTTGWIVKASPPATTTYTVIGTASWGCSNTADVQVIVYPLGYELPGTSITDLSIFPNPNRGEFVVEFTSGQKEPITLKIFNGIGQLVYVESSKTVNGRFRKTFDLRNWDSGLYHMQIMTQQELINKKLMLSY